MTFGIVHVEVEDQKPIVVAGDAYELGKELAARLLIAPVHKVVESMAPEDHTAFVCGLVAMTGGLIRTVVGAHDAARVLAMTADAVVLADLPAEDG